MDFPSKIEYHSKIIPEAVVTFRRCTAARRAEFLDSAAKYRAQIRNVRQENRAALEEYVAAHRKAEAEAKQRVDARIEAEGITRADAEKAEWDETRFYIDYTIAHPEYAAVSGTLVELAALAEGIPTLRALFVGIEGVTVDNHAPTIDELISAAPDPFLKELIDVAVSIATLDPNKRGEPPWPGTSPQAEDGKTPSTTAESAESVPAAA